MVKKNSIIYFALIIQMVSCTKEEQTTNNVPINSAKYFLNPTERALLNFFSLNDTIAFFDSLTLDTLLIKADAQVDVYQLPPGHTTLIGEYIDVTYNNLSDSVLPIRLDYLLFALSDTTCEMWIYFNTGAAQFCSFAFNPQNQSKNDSIYITDSIVFPYNFLDSISFAGQTFQQVYYLKNNSSNNDSVFVSYCYFNKVKGVVAFKDLRDNKFWIRKN
jgi:hypothetical protein